MDEIDAALLEKLFSMAVRKPALVALNDENARRTVSAACAEAKPSSKVRSQ